MSELTDCLSTSTPKVLPLPAGIFRIADPVKWGLKLIENHPKQSTLHRMNSASHPGAPLGVYSN